MKYFKRLKIYKDYSGNNTFNPETLEAYSYRWWKYIGVVEGKTVFNNFRYSVTTAKHQRNAISLLKELGIKIDIYMPIPSGLQHGQSLAELVLEAEEQLCLDFLNKQAKAIDQYQRAKARKEAKRLAEFTIRAASHESHEAHMQAIEDAKGGAS